MRKLHLLLLVVLPLFFAGCSKDDDNPQKPQPSYQMSWTEGANSYNASLVVSSRTIGTPNFIQITAFPDGSLTQLPSITLILYASQAGTYSLSNQPIGGNEAVYVTVLGGYGTQNPGGGGSVTISELQWLPGGRVAGSFTLNLVSDDNDNVTKTVTGTFSTKFPL